MMRDEMKSRTDSRTFLSTQDTRSKLDRVFIVRITPELGERITAAILEHPALAGLSRSEFARRALIYALDSLAHGSSAKGISG
jgi:hypothetical protein